MKYSLKMTNSRSEYWNHDVWTKKTGDSAWQTEPCLYTLTKVRRIITYMNYHYHWHTWVEIHAIQH